MSEQKRHKLSDRHPVIGDGWFLLDDNDVLQDGDQTAYVSELLSYRGGFWANTDSEEWDGCRGKSVRYACEESGDADGHERVFRRRSPPPPNTVRVRIAVAVREDGMFCGKGWNEQDGKLPSDEELMLAVKGDFGCHTALRISFIEAPAPCPVVPQPQTIEGRVER